MTQAAFAWTRLSAVSMGSEAKRLLACAALGSATALLTWGTTDVGLGWLVTNALLAAGIVLGVGGGRPGRAAWILAGVSVWLAGMTAWRASDWALASALPGSVIALVAASLAAARTMAARDAADLGVTSLHAVRAIPMGIGDAARLPGRVVGDGARRHSGSIMRGALLGAPLALFFTLLLSADAGFRDALERITASLGNQASFGLFAIATTVVLLISSAVLAHLRSTGRAAAPPPSGGSRVPYRAEGDAPELVVPAIGVDPGPRIRPLTWAIVLGQVVVVFSVYVVATWRSLFEGHAHLQAAGTETYADYVHSGFVQVSLATWLAVACVVGGHVLLRPRTGSARIAGGRGLVGLELGLLLLVGVTLASCVHRLSLYEEAYGYTYLRLGVWLAQIGIGGLLALTAARSVARASASWSSALVWSGVLFVVAAGSIDADGWIGGRNVERARAGARLDTGYLQALSEDAAGVLPDVTAIDPAAASELGEAWQEQRVGHGAHGWRSRRGLGARFGARFGAR